MYRRDVPIMLTTPTRSAAVRVRVRRPVHKRVDAWLRKRGQNQNDLADAVGIRASHLSMILTGSRAPSLRVAKRLQEITRIRATAFVSDKGGRS